MPAGRYFLKRRNPRYCAPAVLRHDHALMEHLAAKGLCTPLALVSRAGSRWVELDNRIYELYPYMPGAPHDPDSEAEIAEAGRQLAAFHKAAADFDPPPGKAWPRYHDPANTIPALEWAAERARSREGPTPGGRQAADALREVTQLLEVSRTLAQEFTAEEYAGYPSLMLHGDWHPANVRYAAGRVCAIFDLDWATPQPRPVDLADGLIYFAGQRAQRMDPLDIRTLTGPFTLHTDRVRTFLRAYLERASISSQELEALPKFMLARWLYSRADPMRRKLPPEEALDYLLAGVWEPIATIRRVASLHKVFT